MKWKCADGGDYFEVALSEIDCINPSRDSLSCFFIVNNTYDENLARKIAYKFMKPSCNYGFYGKHYNLWEGVFNLAAVDLISDETVDTVAMTSGWSEDEIGFFVSDIFRNLKYGYTEPTDVYVFYDDEELLKKIKKRLRWRI